MTSIMDSKEGFERLKKALLEIDKTLKDGEIIVPIKSGNTTIKKMELWEAKNLPSLEIQLNKAKGKISGSMVCLYPPGSPVVLPGEELTEDKIKIIEDALKEGIHVTGLNNGLISVVN